MREGDQNDADLEVEHTQVQEEIPELNSAIENNMLYFFGLVGVAFLVFMVIMYKLFPKKAEIEAVMSTLDVEPTPAPTPTVPLIQPIQTATVDISSVAQKNTLEIPPIFDLPVDTSPTVVMLHDEPTPDVPSISVPKSQKPLHNNIDDEEDDDGFTLFGEVKKNAKTPTKK